MARTECGCELHGSYGERSLMKAVLFDLDGTLIDTAADFIRIIQDMCRDKGIAVVSAEDIRVQVSEGARAMVKLVYPELDVEDPVLSGTSSTFSRSVWC